MDWRHLIGPLTGQVCHRLAVSIKLHSVVSAGVRRLGRHPQEVARLVGAGHFATFDKAGLPLAVIDDGLHEIVGYAHGIVGVLKETEL